MGDNVQVNGDTEEAAYGNVVRFSCKLNNQILIGSPEVYCDEKGDWSDLAPTCKGTKTELVKKKKIGENFSFSVFSSVELCKVL